MSSAQVKRAGLLIASPLLGAGVAILLRYWWLAGFLLALAALSTLQLAPVPLKASKKYKWVLGMEVQTHALFIALFIIPVLILLNVYIRHARLDGVDQIIWAATALVVAVPLCSLLHNDLFRLRVWLRNKGWRSSHETDR